MEVLLLLVAFWLILVGVYGVVGWLRWKPAQNGGRKASAPGLVSLPRRAPVWRGSAKVSRPGDRRASVFPTRPSSQRGVPGVGPGARGLSKQMEQLRVEQLRSEITSLSNATAALEEPSGARRHGSRTDASLRRPLRRHLRQERSFRAPNS